MKTLNKMLFVLPQLYFNCKYKCFTVFGTPILGDTQKPPGWSWALGSCGEQGLDQGTSGGPFQPHFCCGSMRTRNNF